MTANGSRAASLWIACLLLLSRALVPGIARAEDSYGEPALEEKDVVVVQWADHLSFGLINSVIGLAYGGVGIAYNRIKDRQNSDKPGIRLDASKQQLVLKGSGFFDQYDQNSGLFHLTKEDWDSGETDLHEAGHGKQSGLLGPLYLPVTALDILIEGYHPENLTESWADANMRLGGALADDRRLKLFAGSRKKSGRPAYTLGLDLTLIERNARVPLSDERKDPRMINTARTRYQYLNLGFTHSRAEGPAAECAPPSARGRTVELTASILKRDFLVQWKALHPALRVLIEGGTETGRVTANFEHRRIDSRVFDQRVGFGARIGDPGKVSLDAVASIKGGVGGIWSYGSASRDPETIDPGFMLLGGYGVKARLSALDRFEASAQIEREHGTGGYARTRRAISISSNELFGRAHITEGGTRIHTTWPKSERFRSNREFCAKFLARVGSDLTEPNLAECERTEEKLSQEQGYEYRKPARVFFGAELADETEIVNKPGGNPGKSELNTLIFHIGGRL